MEDYLLRSFALGLFDGGVIVEADVRNAAR